jgi:hypothetical protein
LSRETMIELADLLRQDLPRPRQENGEPEAGPLLRALLECRKQKSLAPLYAYRDAEAAQGAARKLSFLPPDDRAARVFELLKLPRELPGR